MRISELLKDWYCDNFRLLGKYLLSVELSYAEVKNKFKNEDVKITFIPFLAKNALNEQLDWLRDPAGEDNW